MGRPTEGWKLRWRNGRAYVRFSAHGRSLERATGETDRQAASAVAARIYAAEIRKPGPKRLAPRTGGLAKDGERWLAAEEPLRDEETNATYALYLRTHWVPFFRTTGALTARRIEQYRSARLRRVAAATVAKELVALRAFVRWLGLGVDVPGVPRRAVGRRRKTQWRGTQDVSPDEVEAILGRLSSPARERYVLAYETALRPATIDALSVPENWRPGATEILVSRDIDKARAGRPVPLTPRAIEALTKAAPKRGRIFRSRHRKQLKAAALAVLGPERGGRFAPMDLRAARITLWLERTGNLPGTQYLAGHAQATTTARYAKPTLRAALEVLGKTAR